MVDWKSLSLKSCARNPPGGVGVRERPRRQVSVAALLTVTAALLAVAAPTPAHADSHPVVTVAAGTVPNTFSATDDDPHDTTWHYAWITGSDPCGPSTTFPSAQTYTEGNDVSYGTSNLGQRLCLRAVDSSSNTGYGTSDIVDHLAPPRVPFRISEIMATPGDESVTLTWEAPYDGGSPITQYIVQSNPSGGLCITSVPGCTMTGLANGTAYDFEVSTFNAIGYEGSYFPLQVTPTAASRAAPGAPTAVQATAGDRSASVTWNAPTDTGSSRITSYTATATPGGRTCTTTTGTACTVTGLSNGTSYTFTVTATNSAGTSPVSARSAPTTPEQPATDPPATDPPATDPPATDPPATNPPATNPPTTAPGGGGGGGSGSSDGDEEPAPDDGERAALMFEDVGGGGRRLLRGCGVVDARQLDHHGLRARSVLPRQ